MTNNEKDNDELLILDDNVISTEPEELIMEDNLLSADDDTSLITFDDEVLEEKTDTNMESINNNLESSENDLLIMEDNSENLLMEDNLVSKNNSSNNFEEVMLDKIQAEKEVKKEESSLDLGTDLFSDNKDELVESPKVEEKLVESPKVEEKPKISLDLGDDMGIDLGTEESISNVNPVDNDEKEEIFDLDTATAVFISQLNTRKQQIVDLIKSDNDNISDLEEQIKVLRDKVVEYKKSIKLFNSENEKIDAKIKLVK